MMIPARKLGLRLVQLLVLTIPLEISKLWFPFLLLEKPVDNQPVSLIDFSRIALLCLTLVLLFWFSAKMKLPAAPYRYFAAPTALLGVYIISLAFTPAPTTARNEIIRLVFHLLIALSVVWTVKEVRDVQAVLAAFRWTTLILGGIVLFQALTGVYLWNAALSIGESYNATMADPNILARYMVIGFFTWLLSPAVKRGRACLVRLVAVLLCLLVILLSRSRGTWVIFAVLLVGLALVGSRLQRRQVRWMLIFSVLFTVAAASQSNVLLTRLQTFRGGVGILGRRINLIQVGLAMFRDHPVLGVGLGGFPVEYVTNYCEFLLYPSRPTTLSHTYLVTTAAELGVVGLSITLLFLIQALQLYRRATKWYPQSRNCRDELLVALIAVLTIFMGSQTEARFWEDPYLWVFWGLLVAAYKLGILRQQRRVLREGMCVPAPSH